MNDIFNENVSLKTETPAFAKHVLPAVPSSEVYLEDCVKALKRFNDNHFDLAIVDPPYGINASKGTWGSSNKGKVTDYGKKDWDKAIPTEEYFLELQRVSKNQIIWGANHFISKLPIDSSCWIVWDKENGNNDFADCELAWTSFKTAVRKFKWKWHGFLQQNMKNKQERIHPTEKPIDLMKYLIKTYSNETDMVLDNTMGVGTTCLAAKELNRKFIGIEKEPKYYEIACQRCCF